MYTKTVVTASQKEVIYNIHQSKGKPVRKKRKKKKIIRGLILQQLKCFPIFIVNSLARQQRDNFNTKHEFLHASKIQICFCGLWLKPKTDRNSFSQCLQTRQNIEQIVTTSTCTATVPLQYLDCYLIVPISIITSFSAWKTDSRLISS